MDKTKLLKVQLVVTHKNGKPCIELRTASTDEDTIRALVAGAIQEVPVLVQPYFPSSLRSFSLLVEKGIVIEEDGQFKLF